LGIEYAWESHCNEIQGILLDNKSLIGRLLGQSIDSINTIVAEDLADFIDQMMVDYCAENFDWFHSISEKVQNLKYAQDSNDKERATVIIDEIIDIEEDVIIKKVLNNLKRPEIRKDFVAKIHETISQYYRIFPIFDLSRIDEIKIGIVLHEKISG